MRWEWMVYVVKTMRNSHFPLCVISWVQLQVQCTAQSSYIQVHYPFCGFLTLTVLPCNNSTSDTICVSIYLLMNVLHMHGNLCDGRHMVKRWQKCMSDIRVMLDVTLQQGGLVNGPCLWVPPSLRMHQAIWVMHTWYWRSNMDKIRLMAFMNAPSVYHCPQSMNAPSLRMQQAIWVIHIWL